MPLYGSIVVALLSLWLLLAGTAWVKWTAKRLVFSSSPRANRFCSLSLSPFVARHCPCPMWKEWNCCCLPFHSLVQVKHAQVRSARVAQSFIQSLFGIGNIELSYIGSGTLDGVTATKGRTGRIDEAALASSGTRTKHTITVRDIPQVGAAAAAAAAAADMRTAPLLPFLYFSLLICRL